VAERKHRHMLETACALMIAASLLPHFWAEVVSTSTYLINLQTLTVLQGGIPLESLFPSLVWLRLLCSSGPSRVHRTDRSVC
jgi:hypothetical protein